jgi:hypothetical protein
MCPADVVIIISSVYSSSLRFKMTDEGIGKGQVAFLHAIKAY